MIWENGNPAEYITARSHIITRFKAEGVWKFMNAAYIEECNSKVAPRFDQYVTDKMTRDETDLNNPIALELRILDAQVADGTMTVAQR